MNRTRISLISILLSILLSCAFLLTACGQQDDSMRPDPDAPAGTRDNTPVCLVPEASGKDVYKEGGAEIDYSNLSEGYICARYPDAEGRVKLRITCPDTLVYTYNLSGTADWDVLPLTSGDGTYKLTVYSNVKDNLYATICTLSVEEKAADAFRPFLYPNQYCDFSDKTKAVALASDLCRPANEDIDAVSILYNYVTENITYDTNEAKTVESGYLPDVDEVLETKKGICFDYAALLCAMLRSQRIPARLEIGYAGTAYHAWISVYLQDIGWVDGIIQFDGTDWSLMDPTFAANSSSRKLRKFIGNSDNYRTKFIY